MRALTQVALGASCSWLLAGCGGAEQPPSACALAGPRAVMAQLAGHTRRKAPRLAATAADTATTSSCLVRGRGVTVRTAIDRAAKARTRYEGRYVERLEFFNGEPQRTAVPVPGLADDRVYAPAGAFWVRSLQVLTAFGDGRLVTVSVDAPGLSPRAAQRVATALAGRALGPHARHPGAARGGASGTPAIALVEPQNGETVRAARVRLAGSVNPRNAVVTVGGARARVQGGAFAAVVSLRPGRNTLVLAARRAGRRVATATATLDRGAPGRLVGVRYAARAPGRVPPVNGERLDDALAILAGTHVRARLRIGDDAYRGPIERAHAWRVCFTDPAQTHRIARGRRVLVVIDRVTGRTGGGPPCDFF